jgi:hypothetical protein
MTDNGIRMVNSPISDHIFSRVQFSVHKIKLSL